MNLFRKDNHGFSLIEIIVAVAIITIAGTALFAGFVQAMDVHRKTTRLQMAEDVAQQVAEEFNSHTLFVMQRLHGIPVDADGNGTNDDYVDIIARNKIDSSVYNDYYENNTYGYFDNSSAVSTDIISAYEFKNMGYSFGVIEDNGDATAKYMVDVLLTARYTKKDEKTKVTAADYATTKKTTYQQNQDVTNFYEVGTEIGTNTFVVPDIQNIYSGNSVVVSDEINSYDFAAVNDLRFTLKNLIDQYNVAHPTNPVMTASFESGFDSHYNPMTNISNESDVRKTTEINLYSGMGAMGTASYYYIVKVSYEFDFDISLLRVNAAGVATNVNLSGLITDANLTPPGGTTYYTINKSGTKYTVTYSKEIEGAPSYISDKAGTFGGEIKIDGADPITPSSNNVPYIYFLYRPFNVYYCNTAEAMTAEKIVCNDVVKINYDGTMNGNQIKVFLVGQEVRNEKVPAKDTTVSKIILNGTLKNSTYFHLYTNCTEAFTATNSPTTNMSIMNYLTNSVGETDVNHYEMNILVKDLEGNVVARLSTVKED